MNTTRRSATGKLGLVVSTAFLAALTGCVGYVEQPRHREVYAPPPPPPPVVYVQPSPVYVPPPAVRVEIAAGPVEIEIRSENDFYEPLSSYGRWEVVGSYGRCWIPGRVDPGWRPYCQGTWQRTDAGWYWASDEPWAWATYHYGRWDLSPQFGWYWVPQTQWAPAWVSWHEGGGFVGWAPLQPSARMAVGGSVTVNVALIAPRAYVFVEQKRFLQPVRPTTVVVNNTTIINKTVNITNIKVVNNTVINEGPRTQVIEQASGQKVQAVPVRELRRKQEAEVVARQRKVTPASEKKEGKVQVPARTETAPPETKAPVDAQRRTQESAAAQEQSQKNARELANKTQLETQRRASEATAKAQEEARNKIRESEKSAQLESQQHGKELEKKARAEEQTKARELAAKTQVESQQRANEAAAKAREETQRNVKSLEKKQVPEQPATNKATANEKGATKLLKKDHKKEGKDHPAPPEKPVVVPPATSP